MTVSRVVKGQLVFTADDGRVYVVKRNGKRLTASGEPAMRRVYGEVVKCEGCKREFFRKPHHHAFFCTNSCSKKGERNPGRRRPQKKPLQTADKIFARVVRARGVCENCARRVDLQCAHGFSRRYRGTRWDERNAFCLCRGCHFFYTFRPLEWDDWLRQRWGQKLYEEMRSTALAVTKVDWQITLATLYARELEIQELVA